MLGEQTRRRRRGFHTSFGSDRGKSTLGRAGNIPFIPVYVSAGRRRVTVFQYC
jgi:hypothetical protein